MNKLCGAIFGCGMVSEFHLRAWLRIPEVEIVALGDQDLRRAQNRRDQFVPSARIYTTLSDLLTSEQVDFADLLTPPAAHGQHCREAMEAGVHLICQKPLSETWEEASALAQASLGYPKLFAIHENHRYRPWFQPMLQEAKSGRLGDLNFARFEHLNAGEPEEAYKTGAQLGIFLEYGSHLVDMMRSVLGEPARVYARMHRINERVAGESLVHAAYEFPNATAVVDVAWKQGAVTQGSVLLTGNAGEAFYEGTLTRGEHGRLRITQHSHIAHDQQRSPYADYLDSFYLLQRELGDFMLGRRDSVVQRVGEHLKTLRCTFGAYESAKRGTPVNLS